MAEKPLNLKYASKKSGVSQHTALQPYTGENNGIQRGATGGRPWLGVHFLCAKQYLRVFREPDGSRYIARCPTCGRSAIFRVGQGGTSSRQFEVDCR